MAIPILATKLHIPAPRPKAVSRWQLIDRLNEGLYAGRKLTLISAPAGFGKTMLVSQWIAECEGPVAWLSLDEGDNDLARFLAYLVAALQTVAPTVGAGVESVLQSSQPPVAEAILTVLLNDIAAVDVVEKHFVLVLDDYHRVDTRAVDDVLIFLLEHLPRQMHLVMTTREDPPFPLARLRARGQLSELRAADLRFTASEAAEFLNSVMGLGLSAADVAALEVRTEGWIAGLQLAALSMQGRQDISGFIRAFAGDHRYIVDYLVTEVLQRQPEPVRRFLLQTAILDQLSGPLCDAVLGKDELGGMKDEGRRMKEVDVDMPHPSSLTLHPSSFILEYLERANLFVVPLDDQRHWYRYHHLFADVLQAHLQAELPDRVATLHQRASEWYEQHGLAVEAIRHALAAEDFARAADLFELVWPTMRRSRQEATLLGWLKALPDELLRDRPVLSVAYAHVLLANGKLEGVAERLRDAEQRLDAPAAAMIVVDDEEFRHLPGMIAIARTGLALARGDVPGAVTYARRALDLATEDDHLTRGGAAGFLGLAAWTSGDLETAHQTFAAGMVSLKKAGGIADAVNGANILAAIRMAQGRLRQAMRTYEQGLELATVEGVAVVRGAADMYVGMSEIYRERNDLDAAAQHLLKSREMGEHSGFPQNRYRWHIAMARLREAEGNLDGALDLLDEAERLYMSDFAPNVRPIAALKARVWVVQGRLDDALDWVYEQGLSADDDLSYVREFEHITLVRILAALQKRDGADSPLPEAKGLPGRLLIAAEEGQRTGSLIEILIVQALVQQAQEGIPTALALLERALTLAEPEGYVRIFVDEGPPMAALLQESAKKGIAPSYVRHLLNAFGKAGDKPAIDQTLIEPLSERELEVLRLLATDLNGPELARELMVSLSTIRTHTQNIYSKLGVNNRRAAVRRAEELALI